MNNFFTNRSRQPKKSQKSISSFLKLGIPAQFDGFSRCLCICALLEILELNNIILTTTRCNCVFTNPLIIIKDYCCVQITITQHDSHDALNLMSSKRRRRKSGRDRGGHI